MRTYRRLLCVLLALAALSVTTVFPGAADGGFSLTVSGIQRLTPGAAFDPGTAPEVAAVSPEDVFVLTVAFRNDTAAAVDVSGFTVKLWYDAAKVTPYTGTAPFTRNPYQSNNGLTRDYQWIFSGNTSKDGFISVSAVGSDAYAVAANSELVLARMAFQASADASGEAAFTFDGVKTDIINASRKSLSLAAFQPVRVALGEVPPCAITSVTAGRVTLTNPAPVTLAVSCFDADGKFVSASTRSVPADAGSVPVDFGDARKAYVMLFDDNFRPLCERCPYVMN
ncbi:MAG: hypothetical protein IKO14_08230 [Oscillibacter sp.]|nr:hypothetical protein [Oscillibacter sp.]